MDEWRQNMPYEIYQIKQTSTKWGFVRLAHGLLFNFVSNEKGGCNEKNKCSIVNKQRIEKTKN